jgi:thiol-disulfide isomerase/thioredoxin
MTPLRALRIVAACGVLALGITLVWRVTHQHNGTAAAILHDKVVPAPAFRVPHLSGPGKLTLASFRGKAVVLNFWGSACVPCKKEMPRLQAASQRWASKGVRFVGMDSIDFRGPARAFVKRRHVTYPIGFDGNGDVAIRYGVSYTPTTFFIDRTGRIVKHFVGPVSDKNLDAWIGEALSS